MIALQTSPNVENSQELSQKGDSPPPIEEMKAYLDEVCADTSDSNIVA
jgi:hypothetical protein